jgi:hypothetical protein
MVAQVSNLLYRRLPVGKAPAATNTASEFRVHAAKSTLTTKPAALKCQAMAASYPLSGAAETQSLAAHGASLG